MNKLFVQLKEPVIYNEIMCKIVRIIDSMRVSIQEDDSEIIHTVEIYKLSSGLENGKDKPKNEFILFNDHDWETAQYRYGIILPILNNRGNQEVVLEASILANVHRATIYRWLDWYESTGMVSSLIGKKKTGGKGKSRLSDEQDKIIKDSIDLKYLSSSRKSITSVIREISIKCKEREILAPHPDTIRNRIRISPRKEP